VYRSRLRPLNAFQLGSFGQSGRFFMAESYLGVSDRPPGLAFLREDATPDAATHSQRADTARMTHRDLAAFEVAGAICRRFPAGPQRDQWLTWLERVRAGGDPLPLPAERCSGGPTESTVPVSDASKVF
jgi:hypothetical protein